MIGRGGGGGGGGGVTASPSISTTPSEARGRGCSVERHGDLDGRQQLRRSGHDHVQPVRADDPNCDGEPAYTQTVTADHNSPPDYATTNSTVTADTAGTWNWTADFSGDANNNPSAAVAARSRS